MEQLDYFIQSLPQELRVQSFCYQPQQILSFIFNLKKQYSDVFVYESNLTQAEDSVPSYSVIAFKKLLEIQYNHQTTTLISTQKSVITSENPISILKKTLKHYASQQQNLSALHPFFPFLIGRLSYDFVSFTETACCDLKQDDFQPLIANIYQHYLLFDHDKKTASFISISAEDISDDILNHLEHNLNLTNKINSLFDKRVFDQEKLTIETSDQEFALMIDLAKKYIVDGDVFQLVLSRNFYYPLNNPSFFVYQALRNITDAAYLFYFQENDKEYLGASPEKLVSVKNNVVETCPLAGTRKRTHTLSEKFIEEELLSDDKEHAEHMMLVDLARNDVGAISKAGSVFVDKLKQLKKYSHVMHLSSSVKGTLKENYDAFDALMHCFPAGTLTGAPKIRAIQLIEKIETSSRNFYGGAIFIMDLEHNLESCIAIRMAEISNKIAKIRTGAGIVFDSEHEKEILETKNKASVLLHAISLSQEYAHVATHR